MRIIVAYFSYTYLTHSNHKTHKYGHITLPRKARINIIFLFTIKDLRLRRHFIYALV